MVRQRWGGFGRDLLVQRMKSTWVLLEELSASPAYFTGTSMMHGTQFRYFCLTQLIVSFEKLCSYLLWLHYGQIIRIVVLLHRWFFLKTFQNIHGNVRPFSTIVQLYYFYFFVIIFRSFNVSFQWNFMCILRVYFDYYYLFLITYCIVIEEYFMHKVFFIAWFIFYLFSNRIIFALALAVFWIECRVKEKRNDLPTTESVISAWHLVQEEFLWWFSAPDFQYRVNDDECQILFACCCQEFAWIVLFVESGIGLGILGVCSFAIFGFSTISRLLLCYHIPTNLQCDLKLFEKMQWGTKFGLGNKCILNCNQAVFSFCIYGFEKQVFDFSFQEFPIEFQVQ